MPNSLLTAENLGKEYFRGETHNLLGAARSLLRGAVPRRERFWALRDVSFEVGAGEVLGVMGPNGAGKSTLLKILSGVTHATSGSYRIGGRFVPLLEVGAGFHPELTGRQNIFLNGALLGMSREEIRRQFEAIVAFSELEAFLDTPVKHYSSGMYVRLGFAISVHTRPEVLLVDEVLAVGDLRFVLKSYSAIMRMKEQGTAILLVTHNLDIIRHMASKVLLLDQGQTEGARADVQGACNHYRDTMLSGLANTAGSRVQNDPSCTVSALRINGVSPETGAFPSGKQLKISVDIESTRPTGKLYLIAGFFHGHNHQLLSNPNMFVEGAFIRPFDGPGQRTVLLHIPHPPFTPGAYLLSVQLSEDSPMKVLDWHERLYPLILTGDAHNMGPVMMEHRWEEEAP